MFVKFNTVIFRRVFVLIIQALSKEKQLQKEENAKGLDHEENLITESANREELLVNRINSLEVELSKLKQELERLRAENLKLSTVNNEFSTQFEALKDLNSKQKSEIKELKQRENRLLNDTTELEEDNVQLQQQLAKLRENLIELDSIKHENKALQETVSCLYSTLFFFLICFFLNFLSSSICSHKSTS